ncbi:MAG TPA: GNAT family protein [Novosphingobium sp.]|nr:GNAT family protein [Novosphingobium sp.]
MFVRTERLFLRPAWPEDVDDVLGAIEDYDVQPGVGVEPLPRTARELQRFIEQPRDPRLPHFFIYLRAADGPELVGGIGFARTAGDVEMGYWVHPRYRGRGYATEAVRAVLKQARSLGHRQVYAKQFVDCAASARVLEGLGFTLTEEARERHAIGESACIYVIDLERSACAQGQAEPMAA